jgi:hypothetical protein
MQACSLPKKDHSACHNTLSLSRSVHSCYCCIEKNKFYGKMQGNCGVGLWGVALYAGAGGISAMGSGAWGTMKNVLAVIGAGIAVSGCAAIFDGTTQQISVNTTPPDARCKFTRNGGVIADIASTPSAVTIPKTKHDITIVCSKAGYEDATFINKSGIAGATFANILGGVVTGGVAWAIDSGSGADNKYESQVNMSLAPSAFVPAASPPAAALKAEPSPSQPTSPRGPAPVPVTASGSGPGASSTSIPSEMECVGPDGSRLRITATACPGSWKRAQP